MDALWPLDAPCDDADYQDMFTAATADPRRRSAETWMRATLDGAPLLLRSFVRIGWYLVLGFRPAKDHAILGWPIAMNADEFVVMRQQSRLFDAALLLRRLDDRLAWATRVHFKSRGSNAVWAVTKPLHRAITPYLLRRAARVRPAG